MSDANSRIQAKVNDAIREEEPVSELNTFASLFEEPKELSPLDCVTDDERTRGWSPTRRPDGYDD